MKINEMITPISEIGYADSMPDVQGQFDMKNAQNLNPDQLYDGQTLHAIANMGFLFVFIKNSEDGVGAYVVIDQSPTQGSYRLHRLKNFGTVPGAVTLIVRFITKESGMKLRIDRTENLTRDGFEWLEKLLKNRRGFTITDQHGNTPNADAIRAEWTQSKESGTAGPTSIIIESWWKPRESLQEITGLLPMWTHGLGDPELI